MLTEKSPTKLLLAGGGEERKRRTPRDAGTYTRGKDAAAEDKRWFSAYYRTLVSDDKNC